jgi:hypothetical protein
MREEEPAMKLDHLVGRCLFCNQIVLKPYDPSHSRFCCTKRLGRDVMTSFGQDLELYPTIYPEPLPTDDAGFAPDPYMPEVPDGFAISSCLHRATSGEFALPELPYPVDCGALRHLRCGHATLYNLGDLAKSFNFERGTVTVCDMATYHWSNTLKDPRSWAVVSTALTYGIRHLGVWTAGNAGLSLSKLVYAVNRLLPAGERLTVYCYTVGDGLPREIQYLLHSFGAQIISFEPPSHGSIFPLEEVLSRINSHLGTRLTKDEFWDVTDGWDGVGLYMYRLIGRQLCLYIKPQYIVAPVGTGDLFFGLYQGINDCVQAGYIEPKDCHLVGAIPHILPGKNRGTILENYSNYHLHIPVREAGHVSEAEAIAPKLDIVHTPLLLVMHEALVQTDRVSLVRLARGWQERPAKVFQTNGHDSLPTAAEPSSLLGFAALPWLATEHLRIQPPPTRQGVVSANAEVVVVSSGFGVIGKEEQEFFSAIVSQPVAA